MQGTKDRRENIKHLRLSCYSAEQSLAFIGFGYYAKAKGRSMAWGLCGFLSLAGLVILALLERQVGRPVEYVAGY